MKGRRGGTASPPHVPGSPSLSHPPRPSPEPETNRSRAPGSDSSTADDPGPAGPRQSRETKAGPPLHPPPQKGAEIMDGGCRAPGHVPALQGQGSAPLVTQSRLMGWRGEEGESPAESHHDSHQVCPPLPCLPPNWTHPCSTCSELGAGKGFASGAAKTTHPLHRVRPFSWHPAGRD